MASHPRAIQNRVSFERYLPTMKPRAVFLHTNGGGTGAPGVGLRNWWNTLWADPRYGMTGQGIGSTFQVFTDGQFDQYVDSERVIFAQFQASRWSGAIETEDDGNPATPWTDAQMGGIADILRWYSSEHGIPLRLMANPNDSGIGYHEQFAQWNSDGHTCPGSVREHQLLTELIPSLSRAPHTTGDPILSALPTIGGSDPNSVPYKTARTHPVHVGNARALLHRHGAWAQDDGRPWDAKDAGAVSWFQGQRKLTQDGVIGDQTWAALLDVTVHS